MNKKTVIRNQNKLYEKVYNMYTCGQKIEAEFILQMSKHSCRTRQNCTKCINKLSKYENISLQIPNELYRKQNKIY